MRIFKTRMFNRWANRMGITSHALCQAVTEIQAGLSDGQLGSNLVKQRVRRKGQGKRGSYRTILATNFKNRYIFIYGFAKNERENIDATEFKMLKKLAVTLLEMDETLIIQTLIRGELLEISDGK